MKQARLHVSSQWILKDELVGRFLKSEFEKERASSTYYVTCHVQTYYLQTPVILQPPSYTTYLQVVA
jgi:hypothetical protein